MADARRILLVRLDGVGDALACVPSLEGLRRAFPDAAFGAVCSGANAGLFSPARVSAVHVWDSADEAQTLDAIRAARYTDALVATEEPVGYTIARASGARRRAGFWHRFEKTFKSVWQFAQLTDAVYRPAAWVESPEHEVDAVYGLARALGAEPGPTRDPRVLARWLDVGDPDPRVDGDTLALQISAKLLRNGWPPEALARFAAAALRASGMRRLALLCGPADEELMLAVLEDLRTDRSLRDALVPIAPASIAVWLGSLAAAGAAITPDTGAAHACGMLGVPVIDLFQPERFDQLSRQWRPWAAPSRCLVQPPYRPNADAALGAAAGDAVAALAAGAIADR